MNITVPIALYSWPAVVLLLFATMPKRRAVIASFITAWLFLPMAGFEISGLPDYNKTSATTFGVVIGMLLLDSGRLFGFRPRLVDLPMAIWCLSPFATSLSNGLGYYDGATSVVHQVITWGVPYLIGRVYFSDLQGLRELAIGIVIGGLIYVPLCLLEMRIAPQLHYQLYGYNQHSFLQHIRYGGYRPMVFMQHGLMVAMWMTAATLLAFWLWYSRSVKSITGVSMAILLPVLAVTTVLCKSANALLLLLVGVAALLVSSMMRTRLALAAILVIAPAYAFVRVMDIDVVSPVLSTIASIDAERAQSFGSRLHYEELLLDKAMQRPMLGWGGWGRNRVYGYEGNDLTITDGFWIITLGKYGLIGLSMFMLVLMMPALRLMKNMPPRHWATPAIAPLTALTFLSAVYLVDNLPNAMFNPIFVLAIGGMTGVALQRVRLAAAQPARRTESPRRFVGTPATGVEGSQ